MEFVVFVAAPLAVAAVPVALAVFSERFGGSRDNLRLCDKEPAALEFAREQRMQSGNSTITTLSEKGM